MDIEKTIKDLQSLAEALDNHEKVEEFIRMFNELEEENKKLKKENEELKEELAHYKNTEAIQKSNDASSYNPYYSKSYVDREFNVIP